MPRTVGGRTGWRRLLVPYFLAVSFRCQASSVTGVTGKTPAQRLPRDEPGQRGEPAPVGWLVPHPPSVPAQHRVLVPEHQQFGVLRLIASERQDGKAE
jgi:hypothetical protein